MELSDITYFYEPAEDYAKKLRKAKNLEQLKTVVQEYKPIAADAFAVVEAMGEEDFELFSFGLKKETKGEFAGEIFVKEFGCVLMPEVIFLVLNISTHFGAPWGAAYIMAKEQGHIQEKDGIASMTFQPKANREQSLENI